MKSKFLVLSLVLSCFQTSGMEYTLGVDKAQEIEKRKVSYKEHLVTQKAYELAKSYLYVSQIQPANWHKAAAIVYHAGYTLNIQGSSLIQVITNLAMLNSTHINKIQTLLTNDNVDCAQLKENADLEWESIKSKYENAEYNLLQ